MITVDDLVRREVLCCMSSLVSILAGVEDGTARHSDLGSLIEQAYELAGPIDDYEEAASQAGRYGAADDGHSYWALNDSPIVADAKCVDAESFCIAHDIKPYQWEVFEHWAVSTWFAEKLEAHGEKVNKDFAGLCVWARTCTGQGIASDGVIERIHAETVRS